jgi:hypothetical protein
MERGAGDSIGAAGGAAAGLRGFRAGFWIFRAAFAAGRAGRLFFADFVDFVGAAFFAEVFPAALRATGRAVPFAAFLTGALATFLPDLAPIFFAGLDFEADGLGLLDVDLLFADRLAIRIPFVWAEFIRFR